MRVFLSIFCLLGLISLFSFQSKKSLSFDVNNSSKSKLNALILALEKWDNRSSELSQEEHWEYYQTTRNLYKQVEWLIVFRYPEIEKQCNGGPVPVIFREDQVLQITEPSGFQVLEEAIEADDVNEVERNLHILTQSLRKIPTSLIQYPIQTWEIFDAYHMALSRIMSFSLAAYDSPILKRTNQDIVIVLEEFQLILKQQFQFLQKHSEYQEILELLTDISMYFKTREFEEINQYQVTRNLFIPLQTKLKQLHIKSGYEQYEEFTDLKRAIGTGLHLYDSLYLNPNYSFRGNIHNVSQKQIEFGKQLFNDVNLSATKTLSCASCHKKELAFTDQLSKSKGNQEGVFTKRNSPTLINTAFQNSYFWDLRSGNINDQIFHVIHSTEEFNTTEQAIQTYVNESKAYQDTRVSAYPKTKTVSISEIKFAIEAYVRSIQHFQTKFFKNIRGEEFTYSRSEIEGFNLFMGKANCGTCHFPPHFGGTLPPHFKDNEGEILGIPNSNFDKGLFDLYPQLDSVERSSIYGMFKTPNLTLVSQTFPYMHNGAYKTLEEVMEFYVNGGHEDAKQNFPQQTLPFDALELSSSEINSIVNFLNTL